MPLEWRAFRHFKTHFPTQFKPNTIGCRSKSLLAQFYVDFPFGFIIVAVAVAVVVVFVEALTASAS